MGIKYGQPPYFEISTPDFQRVGSVVSLNADGRPPIIAIEYGCAIRASKRYRRLALRRHVYQYLNKNFVFYKTYKGVRKGSPGISSVVDLDDLNTRSLTHATETQETEPDYINQNLLNSLFDSPSNDYFFVEVSISRPRYDGAVEDNGCGDPGDCEGRLCINKKSWCEIYRYGVIKNGLIVLSKESSSVKTQWGL